MPGLWARRTVRGFGCTVSDTSAPLHDNYDAFLARLDDATKNLSTRAATLDRAVAAVALLVGPYESAVRTWERRRHDVSGQLACHTGSAQSYAALSDLHDVAAKMETMLRARVQRVAGKLAVMQDRRAAIDGSLLELELSRVKLKASRMLAQDRERLSRILAALNGSTVAPTALPDPGLVSDLREAREAVVLAEALIEVKGY